jgi:hypothetical protein
MYILSIVRIMFQTAFIDYKRFFSMLNAVTQLIERSSRILILIVETVIAVITFSSPGKERFVFKFS